MSRILLTGSSGFIGQTLLSSLLAQGHTVFSLVRLKRSSHASQIQWDPEKGLFSIDEFERFDGVIHLVGEPILGRWTKNKKEKIVNSRVRGTAVLAEILSRVKHPPRFFLMASAVGYYGDRQESLLQEESCGGKGFLSEVCSAWEAAAQPLKAKGVRVIQARLGVVLAKQGGILSKLLPVYRWALGGRLGSGRQWMSWIEREDLIRAFFFLMEQESIQGPVNLVSPHPVRQEMFSQMLAKTLHRPRLGHLPAWFLRLFLGEAAEEMLLASTRVAPSVLLKAGFVFRFADLGDALRKAIQ